MSKKESKESQSSLVPLPLAQPWWDGGRGVIGRPCPKLGGLLWVAWQYSVHQVILDRVHPAQLGYYRGHFFIVDVHRGF